MPDITKVTLELIDHDEDRKIATIRVYTTLHYMPVELEMAGLQFSEEITIYGADDDSSDPLYTFPTGILVAGGEYAQSVRQETIAEELLDEDLNDVDEVYAFVKIMPLLPTPDEAGSNEIQHPFARSTPV